MRKNSEYTLFKSRKNGAKFFTFILTVALFLFPVVPAKAFDFQFGPDTALEWSTTLKYAAAIRLEDPNPYHIADVNKDDGNRAFEQYDLINNKISLLTEVDFHHQNLGIFTRARAFYDNVYDRKNANDSPGTNNAVVAGVINDSREFTDAAKDKARDDIELLDLFAYGDFSIDGHSLSLRAGRQVVSWGESLFLFGGISDAQSHADYISALAPGVELKEVFLPSNQVSAQLDLTNKITFSAYYKFEWEKTVFPEAGTFYGSDILDDAGYAYIVAPGVFLRRGKDDEARDSGQYGLSMNFRFPRWDNTEVGLYYLNYHEKTPLPVIDFSTLKYSFAYQEDVPLIGASISTVIGNTNVSGEVSYRKDLAIDAIDTEYDVYQVLTSVFHDFGPVAFSDDIIFLYEIGVNTAPDYDVADADKTAWGHTGQLQISIMRIARGLDLTVKPSFSHNFSGTFRTFTEGNDNAGITLSFIYKQDLTFDLIYKNYYGAAPNSSYSDRDNLGFSIKKTF